MPTDNEAYRDGVNQALHAIAASGMAVEINTSGTLHATDGFYPSLDLLTQVCERGIPLTFGSDAHDPHRVGDGFRQAMSHARAAGYTSCTQFQTRIPRQLDLDTFAG
jgi:histidinol-phosphatase (PHP family)